MSKERIIAVYDYFMHNTDDKHYVTIRQIQDYLLNETNITDVSYQSISRDINCLINSGNDIKKKSGAHNEAFYSLENKGFTFDIIRFIIDSIAINKDLTRTVKEHILECFSSICSQSEIRNLKSRIVTKEECPKSLDLVANLGIIHSIISERKRINFDYGKFNNKKEMVYYHKDRKLLPIEVVYTNDHYYLKCFNLLDSQRRTYRIDRMKNITADEIDKTVIPSEEKAECFMADIFAPDYISPVFLKVHIELRDEMFEKMGRFAEVIDESTYDDSVVIRVIAGINKHFYLWLMSYGDGIEILGPEKIAEGFYEENKKMIKPYEKKLGKKKFLFKRKKCRKNI